MRSLCAFLLVCVAGTSHAADIKTTPLYARLKAGLSSYPAIDTHDHLRPFDEIPNRDLTDRGRGVTLHSIFAGGYYPGINRLSAWPDGKRFDAWWELARHDFDNARATSFYRYLLPAFRDLYDVDFDTITDDQARQLNDRIFANYRDDKWLTSVITERCNIELMFIDPYWARLKFARAYRFAVPVLNVSEIMRGSHRSRLADSDSPWLYAQQVGMKLDTFDDYLAVVERIFTDAVAADCACLKSTQAYQRTLRYENVPREQAAAAFGKSPDAIPPDEQRQFEDFMFWHMTKLSAKYDLPFQIHTGHGRLQGSNPMNLLDLIEANPQTKFILFHGGFPWVGETAAIAMRHRNVWIDSVWLPLLSYTMGKRAYQEWLESMPSDRIMWGADTTQAEGIYAATEFTRQCLAEALAEKVERGELREEHAARIGRQIMRDNALKLFPKLKRQLWRTDVPTAQTEAAQQPMGIYRDIVFPRLLDWMLGAPVPMDYRRRTLADAQGEVLEIGFGTGLNLSCYPATVERLTLVDPERMLPKRVTRRIEAAGIPVEMAYLDAERLPFDAGRFDTVVSTWTLCSIPDAIAALREIRRVLKPGGKLQFLEHGRSGDAQVARRQDRWNRLQNIIGCGCNLNRSIDELIATAGLRIDRLERFQMPGVPKIGAEHYMGSASP